METKEECYDQQNNMENKEKCTVEQNNMENKEECSDEQENGIGLTQDEHEAVMKTWALVKKNFTQNGVDVFVSLFTAYPDYQQLFHKCKDVSTGKLTESKYLRAHGTTFMHGLSTFVEHLDDKETLVQLIDMNTERHFKRTISLTHFKNALALFMGFLKGKLGKDMDCEATNGWQKIIQVMNAVIGAKLQELEKETVNS